MSANETSQPWAVTAVTATVAVVSLGAYLAAGHLPSASAIDWVALAVVAVFTLLGPLLPRVTRFTGREAQFWPVPFVLTVLVTSGVPPALLLLLTSVVLGTIVRRRSAARIVFAASRATVALLGTALLVRVINGQPGTAPTATSLSGLLIIMTAVTFFIAVSIAADCIWFAAADGESPARLLRNLLQVAGPLAAAQIALTPLVALVLQVSPLLTWLVVVPVLAVHLSSDASRRSAVVARTDALTALANRAELIDVLGKHLRGHPEQPAALVLLDMNDFKDVNDALGHSIGDEVLVEIAGRLTGTFADEAMVIARLGGDEFALAVPVADGSSAVAFAERVAGVLKDPYLHADEHLIDVDASVGVSVGPEHGTTSEELFARADIAMYQAKRDKTGVALFDPRGDSPAISRLGIVGSLRRALEDKELYLDYQPKINLHTRRIVGVEALVRWRHPSGVTIPPDSFIPAAERSGLMPRLTDAILDMALEEVRNWRRCGLEVPVAVNVTSTDLLEPGFVENLRDKLISFRTPASHLTLEVTERVLADDLARARSVMVQLNKLGVKMAMDDFGTGWSSLLMLRSLPVNEVKLDRSFVSRAVESEMDRAIVAKVTELCHALELVVVAEGVETEQVLDRLVRLGCDEAQGWYVASPMSPEEVMIWSANYLAENGLAAARTDGQEVATAAASAAAALAALADGSRAVPLPAKDAPDGRRIFAQYDAMEEFQR